MLGGLRTVRGSGISVGISQRYFKAEHMSCVNQTWDGSGKLGLLLSEGHYLCPVVRTAQFIPGIVYVVIVEHYVVVRIVHCEIPG